MSWCVSCAVFISHSLLTSVALSLDGNTWHSIVVFLPLYGWFCRCPKFDRSHHSSLLLVPLCWLKAAERIDIKLPVRVAAYTRICHRRVLWRWRLDGGCDLWSPRLSRPFVNSRRPSLPRHCRSCLEQSSMTSLYIISYLLIVSFRPNSMSLMFSNALSVTADNGYLNHPCLSTYLHTFYTFSATSGLTTVTENNKPQFFCLQWLFHSVAEEPSRRHSCVQKSRIQNPSYNHNRIPYSYFRHHVEISKAFRSVSLSLIRRKMLAESNFNAVLCFN